MRQNQKRGSNGLTDVAGVLVGHFTDLDAATGCTVVLCPQGAVGGVDVRGTAPGTREIALLSPVCAVDVVHAVVISGGSAFGLASADGVMRFLEERNIGFDAGVCKVPIVPAAILFDLGLGRADVRPTAANGYEACVAAHDGPVAQGNVGAGSGASAGKFLGARYATKTGVGSTSRHLAGGLVVAALVAVNAMGNIYDPAQNVVIAGARNAAGPGFADAQAFVESRLGRIACDSRGLNTTLGVVATNAQLTKSGAQKVAQMAHDGLARTIKPAHTHLDGDTIFCLSVGEKQADLSVVGAVAADVVAEAVVSAVVTAKALHGLPSANDMPG